MSSHDLSPEDPDKGRTEPFFMRVYGKLASAKNSRQFVRINGLGAFIKSKSARMFALDFQKQYSRPLDPMFLGDVHVDIDVYYPTRRNDLDESLILDLLQGLVYENDRQVRSRRVRWGLDPKNPRVDITIRPIRPEDYAGG